jgi:hypothetical protein
VTSSKKFIWINPKVVAHSANPQMSADYRRDGFLVKFGFIRSNTDSCVYFREEDKGVLILAIWVDDGLLCGTSKQGLSEVIDYLRDELEITSEAANHFIGIQIARNRPTPTITISQEQ